MPEISERLYGEKVVKLYDGQSLHCSIGGNLEIRKGKCELLVAKIERADIPDLLELLRQCRYKQEVDGGEE